MKNIFRTEVTSKEYFANGIRMANVCIMPAKNGGVKIVDYPTFENEMRHLKCKVHHIATKQKKYQSGDFNYIEKYNGKYGKGFKMYVRYSGHDYGSYVVYYVCDKPNHNFDQYWKGANQ